MSHLHTDHSARQTGMTSVSQGRLVSLDVFRGLTIAAMILVNNPGSWSHVYPPLLHAKWHGWTPTDLIFPFFLFIVGVAMTFSFAKIREGGADVSANPVYRKVLKRSLIIFAVGLLLNGFPYYNFNTMRIPGVLQRIAVCYLFASLITLNVGWRGLLLWIAALLFGYWAMMKLIPVPGYGAGDIGVEGNLAAYVDNYLLHGHMWKRTWDPEGIVSTLPAIATTLSGALTGHLIRSQLDKQRILRWMLVAGCICLIVGELWGLVFPINKALWTSSYVVLTTGAALLFLSLCYWSIEICGSKRWAYPAIVYGMNSITVFVLSGLLARLLTLIQVPVEGGTTTLKAWLYNEVFAAWAGPLNGSLLFAITNLVFWFVLMDILYRRRIFIKI